MARKPAAPSYDGMTLQPLPTADNHERVPSDALPSASLKPRPATATLKQSSEQLMLYLHPAGAKALKRYAVEQSLPHSKVKVHDLILEALEDWFRRHGLREPVRAVSSRNQRSEQTETRATT